MTNKPKAIGTAGETAVVRYLRLNGFEGAERLALHGTQDEGDATLCPGVMVEVKSGHAAETASDNQIIDWAVETEIERVNRGADIGLLVLKRKGKGAANAGQWWCILPGWAFHYLARCQYLSFDSPAMSYGLKLPPVRLTLAEVAAMLRRAGYGTPIEGQN
uniref:Holliday junction resolvase n=1 Tax=uncultured organism TaxID=155900 RepID=A0A7L9QBX6_9ZZZZ|nr:hypothetical protein [uncultured organism]